MTILHLDTAQAEAGVLRVAGSSQQQQQHEFLTANFGTVLPSGKSLLTVAQPFDACSALTNSDAAYASVVLVGRGGGCSFGHKALAVQVSGNHKRQLKVTV
jgi:hypothetical protein